MVPGVIMDYIDEMRKVIDLVMREGASFIDIRLERSVKNYFEIRNDVVEYLGMGVDEGAFIRVLYNNHVGHCVCSKINYRDISNAALNALKIAKLSSKRVGGKKGFYELSSRTDRIQAYLRVDPSDISPEEKVNDLLNICKGAFGYSSSIKSVTVKYMDLKTNKQYYSSEERFIEQEQNIVWLYVWISGREVDIATSAREELGSIEGYTIFKNNDPYELGSRVAERVVKQLGAKTPKGGRMPVVMAPNVVGVFAHEAFGHLAEADLALSGSIIMDRVGSKIGSEELTIIDDPTIPGGFGTMKYDDEGVEAIKVYLIKNGVIKGLMHSRETALMTGTRPTGNARAENYRFKPIIRMRNTIIEPGSHEVEELFEGIKFGYYLKSFRGGQANLDGTFQVGIQEAYEIVNGEVGDPVRNMSICGNTLETLSLIDAIAKDFELEYGRCGKGQLAFVSDGGPHIRVREIMVGGEA